MTRGVSRAGRRAGAAARRDRRKSRQRSKELSIVIALVMQERAVVRAALDAASASAAAYLSPGERLYAATPRVLPPMTDDQMPNRLGLARWLVEPGQPAHRARDRQSRLGAVLRPRPRRDERGLRHAGRAAVASRAARLAGDRARAPEVEPEGAAPADRHLGDVPAGRPRPRPRCSSATPTTGCSRAVRGSGWKPRCSATRRSRRAAC